jgi:glycosyltransferase involved in cell wall biosynthesis
VNIVYIHQHFRTPAMGGGTRSYEFARRLVERGHRVDIVTADSAAPRGSWRTTAEGGATVHWAGVQYANTMPYRQRIGAFGDFARLAAVRAAGIKQDVVLATSTPLSVAVPGVWSKRRNRVPMVFEVRDLWPAAPIAVGALRSPPMRYAAWALEAWAYRNAAHVIALSPDMAEDIRHRFPGVATTVVPNGCDVGTFGDANGLAVRQAHRWLGDRPMILYAGTLGHVNNARYLVRLAASLSATRPDVCVVIIGDGVEARLVRQYAKDNHVLDRNLFMLAAMPKMEVAGWFAAADLGCAIFIDEPSLNPSSPNKVFDTWAAGKPAAVNNEGWIADILRGTGAGLALPPADPVAAGQQIVSFLDDADRVSKARAAARALACGQFSRDSLFEIFEQVLIDAVCRRPSDHDGGSESPEGLPSTGTGFDYSLRV